MEFYIHSNRYFMREEENRAFSLMVLATNQMLEFDRSLRPLLNVTDRWVDYDYFARVLQMTGFGGKKVTARLERAVFSLHATGLADLKDVPSFGGTGIRWAAVRDIYALSGFCLANLEKSRSCTVTLRKQYYSCVSFYARMEQGAEYYLMKEKDGEIRAVAMFGLSYRYFGSRVFELRSVVFADGMDDAACRETVSELASYARTKLKDKIRKLRYEYINPRQAFMVEAIKAAGFRETAHFRKELKSGADLVLLDLA